MLCIINIFRRLRVVCLPSMALSAMACWRCQTTPLTISGNHEGRPARGVAKQFPIDFRNVIAAHVADFLGLVYNAKLEIHLKYLYHQSISEL